MPDKSAAAPLRLILMGTGPFAVPSFEALAGEGHEIVQVVTRPERPGPGNRPPVKSPVRVWAEAWGLPVAAPESINADESVEMLTGARPDLLVVCDYGQILKPAALATARLGGINLHGSLLPAYRGAAPVQWAVLCGEQQTGVSVIHMTPKLDAGPVVTTRQTPIGPKETAGELESRLSKIGIEATLEAVERLRQELAAEQTAGEPLSLGQPQDPQQASRAPRLSKRDGRIVWTRPAKELDWHVRGMQPWPGAYTELPPRGGRQTQPMRLTITDVDPTDRPVPEETDAGTVETDQSQLWVATGDCWLRINRLKPAGRREMDAEEWLRGRPISDGTVLI